MITEFYNGVINFLSFTPELRNLRSKINVSIDVPDIIAEFPNSHPRGFIKEFKRRRTTIVENYIRITTSLDSLSYTQRIQALSLLAEHVTYSRSIKMPLNTARVQLALMKEVVKKRSDKRLQLELLRDFSNSSFGHPRVIRHYLKKLDIIEVPETGDELKDLKMGWDFHVHDSTSYGRKHPIKLVIDAFIKGISELTIVHNNLNNIDAVKEVLEAGKILGININIGLEFSAITDNLRFHYMYILPKFSSNKNRFKKFLKHETDEFKDFLDKLESNEKKSQKNIQHLIESFNREHLPRINDGYETGSIYYLSPLSLREARQRFGHKVYSRRQLGEYLYPKLKAVFENRALKITSEKIRTEKFPQSMSFQEICQIKQEYLDIRKRFRELKPEKIRLDYFAGSDFDTEERPISSLDDIYKLAKRSDGRIKFIQPLEHGLQAAIQIVIRNCNKLSYTEIFNTYDTIGNKEREIVEYARFVNLLNRGNLDDLQEFLARNRLSFNRKELEIAFEHSQRNQIIPAIGSDATGRSTLAPGMGFIFEHHLTRIQKKDFGKKHLRLPDEISRYIYDMAKVPKKPLHGEEKPSIFCLGRVSGENGNTLGDENNENPINITRVWEYLNPAVKNFLVISAGLVPAYMTVGLKYTLLWFAITGARNIFVDLISGKGFNPLEWHKSDINWSNLAQSLFWTGFSVPILGFVKTNFDFLWIWSHSGPLFEIAKFFCINLANGLYLATHNYLRGFDKITIRANFFRSILAWPLSAIFSPLGNALMLPSIVQVKFWSDFVASIIEGSVKYKNVLHVKNREIRKLFSRFLEGDEGTEKLALLDMIYFFNEGSRSKAVLRNQLVLKKSSTKNRLAAIFFRGTSKVIPDDIYLSIKERIEAPDLQGRLIDYIIQHYQKDRSLYLINLVSKRISIFSDTGLEGLAAVTRVIISNW